MAAPRVDAADFTAYFDESNQLAYMRFCGKLSADTAVRLYQWIEALVETIGVANIRGAVVDPRAVSLFQGHILNSLTKESRRVNSKHNLMHVPTVYIVKGLVQENIGRSAMNTRPSHRRVVRSDEQALQFINEWHDKHPMKQPH